MNGIQTSEKPEEKKERMKLLRKLHEPTFEKLGIPEALFIPKLAYKPAGKNELFIAFFASEVAKGQDIYTEFADAEYEPQDPERRLYKWRYNPNYKEEYEVLHGKGIVRYLIPTAELILVKANPPEALVEENATGQLQLFNESENKVVSEQEIKSDLLLKEATVRDLAAILWKQPVSNKQWINDMITKALA